MPLQDIRTCPTYVINLDRRKDRWAEFTSQPMTRQFENLKRFSAVDGKLIDTLKDTRIGIHTRQNIKRHYRRSHCEIVTSGAIGASLSHTGIWKDFLNTNQDYAVVFEDDAMITDKDMEKIEYLTRSLPNSWDIWLLGTHNWAFDGKPINNPKEWWKVNDFTGAHAYVINRRGAQVLLEEAFPIETHIEYYICATAELKGLTILRHDNLRVGYIDEKTNQGDSDTWDPDDMTCPLCIIPDTFPKKGLWISQRKYEKAVVSLVALGIVITGLLMRKN